MSLEIVDFHSLFAALPLLLSHSLSGLKRTWPLTPSSVADWALWDANWPCKNISYCDILPCKMWKTYCRLISVADSYSGNRDLYLEGQYSNKILLFMSFMVKSGAILQRLKVSVQLQLLLFNVTFLHILN